DGPGREHRDRRRPGGDGGPADDDARRRLALSRDPQGGAPHPASAASPRPDAPAAQAPLPGLVQRLAHAGRRRAVLRAEPAPVAWARKTRRAEAKDAPGAVPLPWPDLSQPR